MRRDPRGDLAGRHRRSDKAIWRLRYTGLDINKIEPFDILVSATRSFVGAGIRFFSKVDGRPAVWNHCGQVILRDGKLVVSEANWPEHEYTPVSDYLVRDFGGYVKTAWLRIDPEVWGGSLDDKNVAQRNCLDYHNGLEGKKYTVGIYVPMAAWSMLRNLTPFIRGRYSNIPSEEWRKIFVCSSEVDFGWVPGQILTGLDWFLSSLHKFIPTPEDIYASRALQFIQGWIPERIPLKEVYDDGFTRTVTIG